jgi:hypothetical protein
MNLALAIALLRSSEGFQKTLRLKIGTPNVSKGSVFALALARRSGGFGPPQQAQNTN